jgi:hypothetical protein
LNPIPPAELMSKWERDYADIQGQMIVKNNVKFEELIMEIESIMLKINKID